MHAACPAKAQQTARKGQPKPSGGVVSRRASTKRGAHCRAFIGNARSATSGRIVPSWQLREACRRECIVLRALRFQKTRGASLRACSTRLRLPIANLSRYMAAYAVGGAVALVPGKSCGRKSAAAHIGLTGREASVIAALTVRGQIAPAARKYAARRECRPALRAVLSATHLPKSIRRQIAQAGQRKKGRSDAK